MANSVCTDVYGGLSQPLSILFQPLFQPSCQPVTDLSPTFCHSYWRPIGGIVHFGDFLQRLKWRFSGFQVAFQVGFRRHFSGVLVAFQWRFSGGLAVFYGDSTGGMRGFKGWATASVQSNSPSLYWREMRRASNDTPPVLRTATAAVP